MKEAYNNLLLYNHIASLFGNVRFYCHDQTWLLSKRSFNIWFYFSLLFVSPMRYICISMKQLNSKQIVRWNWVKEVNSCRVYCVVIVTKMKYVVANGCTDSISQCCFTRQISISTFLYCIYWMLNIFYMDFVAFCCDVDYAAFQTGEKDVSIYHRMFLYIIFENYKGHK